MITKEIMLIYSYQNIKTIFVNGNSFICVCIVICVLQITGARAKSNKLP